MARIPFDIKYRPQIESGEYKVVTDDDRPVKIICWEKKVFGGRFEIVGLVPTLQGDTETVQLYCPDGTLIASSRNEKFKLFIITPEQDLTAFEKKVYAYCDGKTVGEELIKRIAKQLLDLARKELIEEQYTSDPRKTDLYKLGKAEALKDLPRWRKYNTPGASKGELSLMLYSGVYEVSDLFIDKGLYIPISDLEKLPKDE